MLQLIDLSHNNGAVELATIKRSCRVDGWLFKCTEGTSFFDPRYLDFVAQARALGDPFGAYHYAHPELSLAAQLDFFLSHAGNPDAYMNDLERGTTQTATHSWAHGWGIGIRAHGDTRSWLYMGDGYAGSTTGAGLSEDYDVWMSPRYASMNRDDVWPSTLNRHVSPNTTGWDDPDVHQFTPAMLGKYDASVSDLTLDDLFGADMTISADDLKAIAKAVASYNDPNISAHTFYGSAAGVRNALDVPTAGQGGVTGALTAESIGAAVVAALPPAAAGGLTMEQVEQAVQAVFAQAAGTPPAAS